MDISIIAGIIFAIGLVAFALIYSRSNVNHRARQANNDGTASSKSSDSSSTHDSGSYSDANCADGSSSCDVGGDGGGGD